MFWNNIARLVLLGIVFLNINHAAAVSFDYVDLDKLVATSDVVIHVKITNASLTQDTVTTEIDDSVDFTYEANILTFFKGYNISTIKFNSYKSLNVGHEYVLLLHGDGGGYTANPMLGDIFQFHREFGASNTNIWLKSMASHIRIPDVIDTIEVNYVSDDRSEYYSRYFSYQLIDWESFKYHILKTLEKP
jgi:hypothetical protein